MKRPIPILFCCCLLWLVPASTSAQDLKFANLGDFHLEGGEVLRDCRIGYRTFGHLNAGASNAILTPLGLAAPRKS
jgi:homoserine O-acetyltransferase